MWFKERARLFGERIRRTLYFRSGYLALDLLAKTGLPIPKRPWNLVHVAGSLAAKGYSPPPSAVRIEYFRPQTAPSERGTPWDSIALGGVVLHQVIGPQMSHATITKDEGAPELLEHLGPAIEEATGVGDAAPAVNGDLAQRESLVAS
jgi:hypothetical protein